MAALAASLLAPHAGAQTPGFKNVYVLPMSGGLDQYLALRLTETGVLQVVTDPQKAEVVLTDRIGGHFEETLDSLFAPKEPVKLSDGKDKPVTTEFGHATMQPLSTGRGAIFLVDRTSRNVVWSTYEKPRNSTPAELNHSAQTIVDRLAKSQKGKH